MEEAISFTEIEKITGGDKQMMKELLEIFIKQSLQNIRDLEEFILADNWDGLKRTAHKIKSSFALMGMRQHRALAEELEKNAGLSAEESRIKTTELLEACRNVIAQTQKKLNSL